MTIEERLKNMERELGRVKRRNRWLLGAILVLVGGLVAAGAFKTTVTPAQAQVPGAVKEVRANKFVIEDKNGTVRAEMGVSQFGPALFLYDENDKSRAMLGISPLGPGLTLYDEKGMARAGLGVAKAGPWLSLWDENIKPRAALSVDKDGPIMMLLDEKGKVIWSAIK